MIDGYVDRNDIANCFASNFKRIYSGSPANDKLKTQFHSRFHDFCAANSQKSIKSWLWSWADILDAAFSLKLGGMDIVISNIYFFSLKTTLTISYCHLPGIFWVQIIYKREHHHDDDDE